MKLVTLQSIDEEAVGAILPGIEIVRADPNSAVAAVRGADILVGNPGASWPEILQTVTNLKWVHVGSAGVDELICPEFRKAKVVLTCAKGDIAGPVLAEHAFALLLGLTRGIAACARVGKWTEGNLAPGPPVFELGGKTMGLVGYGGVGRHLARMAQGFGMQVIAVRRSPAPAAPNTNNVTIWGANRFHEMLGLADVVVVTVPDTPETRGMFDAEAFKRMKEQAIIIAVGRGNTINTEALVATLRARDIAGAGLDVVDPEPLPDDHPLWRMDNVIVTPHIAGNSPERGARNRELILENLRRFVRGEELKNVVDLEAGYGLRPRDDPALFMP